MGSSSSTQQEQSSDEVESSEDEYSITRGMESEDSMTLDAIETLSSVPKFPSTNIAVQGITLNQVEEVEDSLDEYEKVSLIYLLYEEPNTALQYMSLLLRDANYNVLSVWVKHESHTENNKWQDKLLEALSIIQNYQVLKKLGYTKTLMYERFLPLNKSASMFVNPIRKCLYRMCEDFNKEDTRNFISHMKTEMQDDGSDFGNYSDYSYLEMYLLHIETVNCISSNRRSPDLRSVANVCKYMERDNLYDTVTRLQNQQSNMERERSSSESSNDVFDPGFLNIDKTPGSLSKSDGPSSKGTKGKHSVKRHTQPAPPVKDKCDVKKKGSEDRHMQPASPVKEKYDIDPKKPGILLIINNEHFYTECDPQHKHLLADTTKQLEQRKGTEKDQEVLKDTFETFGFEVRCRKDLTHINMAEEVKKTVEEIDDHSSLFVAILSHGSEGVVYGSNSAKLKVTDIQNVMCNHPKLVGKPKILILQSCQGTECQEVNNEDDLETDGPSSSSVPAVPRTADMFIFWATVPGFGAVRHKTEGSWFIQSLCSKMIEKCSLHFEEICLFVRQDVSNKRWEHRKAMVSLSTSTLSKFLYLPTLKVQHADR